MVFSDVTAARQLQREISHQAAHDSLTGLVNRREFEQRLSRVLDTARNEASEHALCYLDLDQFKVINDTCGHAAGDELLRQIAVLFQQKIRRRDTLARLGGDEFAVLMEHCNLEQASRVAEALRSTAADLRFTWANDTFTLGVSIGVVPITPSSESVDALLRAADNACYVAKDAGRNRVHVYYHDDVHLARRRDEMQWVGTLSRALEEGRFELHAQKIADIGGIDRPDAKPEVRHVELLLRLVGADGERILPAVFLPAAERYDLIARIDRWVIERAFGWLAQRAADAEPVLCSINISGASIGEDLFLAHVLERLDETGIAGEQVCFEVTETAAIRNLAMATRFIHTLRRSGCSFALDDFGSGLSSFAYLKSLQVQYLKIDGAFVKDMADDPLDRAMVRSINEVGQLLGMRTIAEFVETQEVLDLLVKLGVDAAQGYRIGRPEPLIAAA
jgi:diguanylate cyclase (GGDEF)-like protein